MSCSATATYVQTISSKKYKATASVYIGDGVKLTPGMQESSMRMLAIGGLTGTIGGYSYLTSTDFTYNTSILDYDNTYTEGQTIVCDVDVILEYIGGSSNNFSKFVEFNLKNITPGSNATGISTAISAASYSIFSNPSGTLHAVKSVTITAKLAEV